MLAMIAKIIVGTDFVTIFYSPLKIRLIGISLCIDKNIWLGINMFTLIVIKSKIYFQSSKSMHIFF